MSIDIVQPPPSVDAKRGGPEWAVLVEDVLYLRGLRILDALTSSAIDGRTVDQGGRLTIFVKVIELEDALFVLASLAFDEPATMAGPLVESGHAKSRLLAKFIATMMAVVAAIVLAGMALTPQPSGAGRCPALDAYALAPRGGCVRTSDGH